MRSWNGLDALVSIVIHCLSGSRPHGDADDLGRLDRVRLLRLADGVVLASVRVVEELVRQVELVVVAETVERTDRVGVVRPAFEAGDVPLDAPRRAAVERLVEAEQV